jgi:hypothetical protein
MNTRKLWHRKSRWERVPDVVNNLPRVLGSSLAALDAAQTALGSTMEAVDAAKATPNMSRSANVNKSDRLSPVRGGLIVVGSAVAVALGSAAVSSVRRRENAETYNAS